MTDNTIENNALIAEITRLRSELDKANEWISVNDRLPEHLDKVLVIYEESDNILMASFHICIDIGPEFMIYFADGRKPSSHIITHWKPLPELPKRLKS